MPKILLEFPHGLGDTVQFGVVLKHLRKYRPDWTVDVICGRGKHTALFGLCHQVFHDQEDRPRGNYDTVAMLGWYENYSRFEDRPNSKITNCLAEVFSLNYDPSLGRYEIHFSHDYRRRAEEYLLSIGAHRNDAGKFNTVLLHYEGNTSTWKKNLRHWHAKLLCDAILSMGRIPVILDWDNRSSLPDHKTIFCPRVGGNGGQDIWGNFGSGDAAMIAALVTVSEAYIGIDSGPGKCASSTQTPTLIVWMEHHPIQFDDPNPNTTHLIPTNWRNISPAERPGVARYFEEHYKFTTYAGEFHLPQVAIDWLGRVLGAKAMLPTQSRMYVTPTGIGDILWALHKIKGIAGDEPINLMISGNPGKEIDLRSVPFLKRFKFLNAVTVADVPILHSRADDQMNDAQGRYRYLPDGERNGLYYLVPNAVLERGERLETWFPEVPIDWDIVNEFDWSGTERGVLLGQALQPLVVFYLGPETGNVDEGHNWGFLWEPKDWIALGKKFVERGCRIAVVGAHYDRSYWERYVREGVEQQGMKWHDFLGKLEIGESMQVIRQSKVFVSYQSGLAIFAHYLGKNVISWWRPDGNSAHPKRLVAFDERMKDAWVNPKYVDRYMGLIYTRCTPEGIFAEVEKRGWLD